MNKIVNPLKKSSMFVIMFLITVIGIIVVTSTITWTTIKMSEKFFIETFSITNTKVLNQIKDNLDSYNQSVVTASQSLLQNPKLKQILTETYTNKDLMTVYYDLNVETERIKSVFGTYNLGLMVIGNNGIRYATDHRIHWPISDEQLVDHKITALTLNEPRWLKYHYYQHHNDTRQSHIVASRAFIERTSGMVYGAMYFAMKETEFRQFYTNFTTPGNDIIVLNKNGRIVSSNRTDLIGEKSDELLNEVIRQEKAEKQHLEIDFKGMDHILLAEPLPEFDMYIINLIDKKTAIGNFVDKKAIFLISMTIALAALMIVFFISRKMTKSLTSLVKHIENAPKQHFHEYVTVSGMYETMQIGNAFNAMLDELHDYVDQLVLSQKQKREAELAALQQQINPHFLYNTLASIKFMVQQGDKEDATKTINALISLLQNTLGNVSETVTIEQEIINLKSYVFINQKRYGNRIIVNYFVEPSCNHYQIPKLILQPFIENSFFHGFNRKDEGSITVLIWKEGKTLICEIVDDGDGMELIKENGLPDTKRDQQHFSGIGVRNVHERIQLIYGEEYGVSITSKLQEGTKVRISMPIVDCKKNNNI